MKRRPAPLAAFLTASLAVCLASAAESAGYTPHLASFRAWQTRYKAAPAGQAHAHAHAYASPGEEAEAFLVWKANLARVEDHNARAARGLETYTVAMNRFADMTNEAYRAQVLRPYGARGVPRAAGPEFGAQGVRLPDSVNWVKEGVITGVKDQGSCGSCWAFSAVAAMEGAYNYKNQNAGSVSSTCKSTCGPQNKTCCSFSEQETVDCTLGGADTCKIGGEPHDGILNVVKRGGQINTESQYPYTSGQSGIMSRCSPKDGAVATGITGYANVTSGNETALAEATVKYPVISIGIDASSFGFQLYDKGVYTDSECKNGPKDLDHGVAIVGFGTGDPSPPGPPPPKPGPANCDKNFKKPECTAEKGCHWCVDKYGLGYCFNEPCQSSASAAPRVEGATAKPYWLVRNSWGLDWGMGGYIAMARNHKNMCGVATDAVYALI